MKKVFAIILLSATGLGFSGIAHAASTEAKAAYKQAGESADADYKVAREKCNSLADNAKDVCVEEASAARVHAKSDAEAKYKNTEKARASARKANADADYSVAKAKCGSLAGNAKDVCIKEAKAVMVSAKADAQQHKEVVQAKADARDDKRDANYKVALEKCDALAGAAKDTCVASAKSQYGK